MRQLLPYLFISHCPIGWKCSDCGQVFQSPIDRPMLSEYRNGVPSPKVAADSCGITASRIGSSQRKHNWIRGKLGLPSVRERERTCRNFQGNSRKQFGVLQANSAGASIFRRDDDGAGLSTSSSASEPKLPQSRIFISQQVLS